METYRTLKTRYFSLSDDVVIFGSERHRGGPRLLEADVLDAILPGSPCMCGFRGTESRDTRPADHQLKTGEKISKLNMNQTSNDVKRTRQK